jgi:ketosteroid isomerase-like protein
MLSSSIPEVQYLLDRQAILDTVNRYARGIDRHDEDIIVSVYHPDAIDEHGHFDGGPDAFAKWANEFHAEGYSAHMHNITTHNCEIDGDTAHTESYCLYVLRRKDQKTVIIGGGRYIDKLTKEGGEWKIKLRKLYIDWRAEADATIFATPNGYPEGFRDRRDPSYARPLERSAGK